MKTRFPTPVCRQRPLLPPVDRLRISPDGRVLAGACGSTVWLADLELGEPTFQFEHDAQTAGLALSASNVAVAVGRRVHVYNVLAGRRIGTARCPAEVSVLRFDGSGERLYMWDLAERCTVVRALTLRRERGEVPVLPTPPTPSGALMRLLGTTVVALHPDGQHLAASMADGVALFTVDGVVL